MGERLVRCERYKLRFKRTFVVQHSFVTETAIRSPQIQSTDICRCAVLCSFAAVTGSRAEEHLWNAFESRYSMRVCLAKVCTLDISSKF